MAHRVGKTRKSFYVLAPVLSVALTLLFVELTLAAFWPVPFSVEVNMYFEPDPHTGFRLRPGSLGHYAEGIPAQANVNGHRDAPVPMKKPEGVFRILLLGDSFTVGANVRQENVYGQLLEDLLNDGSPQTVEVINSGVGGWNPFQYAQYYEYYGRNFEPDLVLVGFFVGNDMAAKKNLKTAIQGRRVSNDASRTPLIELKVFLANHFHLARLLLQSSPRKPDKVRRESCDQFSEHYLEIQRKRTAIYRGEKSAREGSTWTGVTELLRISELTSRDGVPTVVIILPDEIQINPALQATLIPPEEREGYNLARPQEVIGSFLGEYGIAVIDLLPSFLKDSNCLYMNDTHFSTEGHVLAAEIIYDGIVPLTP